MRAILIAVSFLLLMSGCKKEKISDLDILRSHPWQLTDYRKSDGTILLAEPSIDTIGKHTIIQFIGEDSIVGYACANQFFGNYGALESKHSMLLVIRAEEGLGQMSPYCNQFTGELGSAVSFELNDGELFINYDLGLRSFHFIKPA